MGFVAALPLIASGISALGGLFGNRRSTQQQTGLQNTNSSSLTMPAFTAEGTGVLYPLADKFLENLSSDTDLSGYRNAAVGGINHLADVKRRASEENYAARGVFGPAVGTAENTINAGRISDITKVNQSIPLLQQQILQSKLQQGIDLFRSIPEGTNTQGYQNIAQQGTITDPGNLLAGLFGNLGPVLAQLFGKLAGGQIRPNFNDTQSFPDNV